MRLKVRSVAFVLLPLVTVMAQAAPQRDAVGAPPVAPAQTTSARAIFDKYCIGCHSERLKTAGLVLENADANRATDAPEMWERVVKKLRSGAMPPVGMPRPDKSAIETLATSVESILDKAAAAHPNPGRPVVHRLNRAEYTN